MARLVVVRIEDALDDGLDLGRRDHLDQFEVSRNAQRVSLLIVTLHHKEREEVLVVYLLDVGDEHLHDGSHQLLAVAAQAEELILDEL